jgi:AraC family transcriptional regulator of adaptative response / DNA-3-methyladenine glycosylase II
VSVQAVTTTGIYCVPSCSAQPRPGNVVAYPSAAAAEAAGFRACLRGRPYRSAPAAVTGPELVCRAVHLVSEGALDGGTAAGKVSGSPIRRAKLHFARSFAATYGATPARYLARRRIERAQDLLTAPTASRRSSVTRRATSRDGRAQGLGSVAGRLARVSEDRPNRR